VPGTLARVIEREPDWSKVPAQTPPALVRLLKRCLVKDRKLPNLRLCRAVLAE
jgi:hypothetical protein